jgi:hypothetical protein
MFQVTEAIGFQGVLFLTILAAIVAAWVVIKILGRIADMMTDYKDDHA